MSSSNAQSGTAGQSGCALEGDAKDIVEAEVLAMAPWITRIEYAGATYGGGYDPRFDPRVLRFIDFIKIRGIQCAGSKILECGCLEGGHTVTLARELRETTIVAVDIRAENLAKSRLHARIQGITNVEFVQDDLEAPTHALRERYAAVFCVGLLYHLRDAAEFLARCAQCTDHLWLWTVVCPDSVAETVDAQKRGRLFAESVGHPLSSVRPHSFVPTIGTLCDMLWQVGFSWVDLVGHEQTTNGNGPAVLLDVSR